MSDYTQIVDYSVKDALTTGDAAKRIKGSEIDAELAAISTAIASKADESVIGSAGGVCGLDGSSLVASANLPQATTAAKGALEIATDAEVLTGTDTARAVTPAGLEAWAAQNASVVKDLSDLTDPDADVGLFWDESANALVWLNYSADFAFAGTTIGLAVNYANASNLSSGTIPDARIQATGVTQHEASLTIAETQITDGAILARLAANETVAGNWTFSGTLTYGSYDVGYREVPPNSQSGNYGCVLADNGRHVLHPNGAGSGDTFTIPANASVAYPVGTVLTFVNRDSNALSIAITSDTMYLGGTTTTGTRSLAQNGVATAIKVESTVWIITGTGVS